MGLFGFCGYARCNTKFLFTFNKSDGDSDPFTCIVVLWSSIRDEFLGFQCLPLILIYYYYYYIIWGSVPSRYSSLLAAKLVWWLRIILFLEIIIIFVFHLRHFS